MAGFAVAAGFASLFQSGQRGIVVFTKLGRLDLDAQRHVELAQEEFLRGNVDVTLGQVAQVDDVPCGERFLAVAVEGGCLLPWRVDAHGFIGPLSQHGDLLAKVVQAQLVSPAGKDRMREYRLVHRLEVASGEVSNLLGGGTAAGQSGFHRLEKAILDGVSFLNRSSHQPFGKVSLENVVAQEPPKRFFMSRNAEDGTVAGKFGAGSSNLVADRMSGSEGFSQSLILFQGVLKFGISCRGNRCRPLTRSKTDQVSKKLVSRSPPMMVILVSVSS